MRTFKTSEVATIIGVHPNTVRLYEKLELIPSAKRLENGYRVFTEFHIEIFKLARTAFEIEVLQNGLRKQMIQIIKVAAKRDFDEAIKLTDKYLLQIEQEKTNAREAISIVEHILNNDNKPKQISLKRSETAKLLGITVDTLRNWELNGLLSVKRKANGYRMYTGEDITRLKIIRTLRFANYSLEAILRMLTALSGDSQIDILEVLNDTENEDIISVCDQLIISLTTSELNALHMKYMLNDLKSKV